MGAKKEIGNKIRSMRKNMNMTQADLAKAIGQSASSITMYETGRREPDFETLEAFADVFNVPLASLLPLAETDADFAGLPVFVPDSKKFSILTNYMSYEDYSTVVKIFEKAHKKAKEAGEDV